MPVELSNLPDENLETRLGRQLDHLYRFAGTIGSNLEVDTLLDDVLEPLRSIAEGDGVLIALAGGSDEQRLTASSRLGWPDANVRHITIDEVDHMGTTVVVAEPSEALPAPFDEIGVPADAAAAVVPLSAYGQPLGILAVTKRERSFDPTSLKLLNTAGRQLGLAVKNASLFADLETSYHRLIDAQEEIIRSERLAALGALAATLAHEIRNPLATIFSSLSQVRKHAPVEGDSATLLEIAEEEAIRLNQMVSGLLEFARPKMPRADEVHPDDVAREVIAQASKDPEFPQGVRLSLLPGGADFVCQIDSQQLKRALQSVLANAIAAVDPRNGEITIELAPPSTGGKGLVATVSDNGCGIAPEILQKTYEPFFSTKPSGVGLGLAIVKRIVEDHYGSCAIESEPGRGTRIRLLFGEVQCSGDMD